MPYEAIDAVSAGLIGGAMMTLVLYVGIFLVPDQIRMNLFYIFGTMNLLQADTARVYLVGSTVHAGMSVAFALLYALLFKLIFDAVDNVVIWGLLFGFIQWILVGASFGMMGRLHPLMVSQQLQDPGFYGKNYPRPTAVVLLVLYLLYGLIVGWLYTAWA